jgi:hypothetical protein
LVQV